MKTTSKAKDQFVQRLLAVGWIALKETVYLFTVKLPSGKHLSYRVILKPNVWLLEKENGQGWKSSRLPTHYKNTRLADVPQPRVVDGRVILAPP